MNEEVVENPEAAQQPTKFKNWAFRLMIYSVISQAVLAYRVANTAVLPFAEEPVQDDTLLILSIMVRLTLVGSIVMTILSFKNSEPSDYRKIGALVGIIVLGLLEGLAIIGSLIG